ncbi:hypothetical protein [Streptomyces pacificus]|uniref:Uncharacterized protein n=1 Tax=Streptomyces pacificus TaxID=2705029 RepID=A0A6A0B0X2_9ACTN|nr:hypothetical protein [Streptomyces pacificus]GFH38890.1 hypothetical protein SCWH03_51530 [Streptomyces pacificus]
MSRPIPATESRALLAAVREALDIPHPATVGDAEVHDRILEARVMHARIALADVLDHGGDPGWHADYLRSRLAEHPPTGYRSAPTERVGDALPAMRPGETAGEYAARLRSATGAI